MLKKKAFLNLDGFHSTAYIALSLTARSMNITITDCENRIHIIENLYSKRDVQSALFKIDTIIIFLQKIIDFLNKENKQKLITKSFLAGDESIDTSSIMLNMSEQRIKITINESYSVIVLIQKLGKPKDLENAFFKVNTLIENFQEVQEFLLEKQRPKIKKNKQ